jgi:dCTP deaminase
MVLSDGDIRAALEQGSIVITPHDDSSIQPASVDLRLGNQIRVFQNHLLPVIDVKQEMNQLTEAARIDEVNPFVLHPGEFVLGMTLEEIRLPNDIVGRLDGKSSLGRLGLVVHSTAGFVDPGWQGRLTLELSNLANLPINLYVGMKVSQISFMRLSTPAQHPYGSSHLGSKYQGQMEPTPSRFFQNYGPSPRRRRQRREQPSAGDALRAWLDESQFRGSVKNFAKALEINPKTVEEWVYGRAVPSHHQWPKLYDFTGLDQFRAFQRLDEDRGQ